ncbi:MAG: HpcH/HpaI aldolase/citrate lyase family protein [Methylobacter sp.]|nr:HpcH/HpaI aldolase/citrate lyase family protein [Methylobacter sp.]MDP2099618.1 HpcH/HpaI aldolase/citrate lyase family protein [Methylobacter sp.]MDP2429814.1 HpcH/HpaI aldolase/citrate lyase family protein [Methylobacter sp.]MDP3055534.1 HpcH/HpaI aldolase/citrate lyase family protein [Methylobacter sp.]MDP3361340.1 HpcH/HpaI aldolase/citrate lyase family protein [Methylobacter sp.]
MPAHRFDLMDCANGEKLQDLRSMIFCTEDAVSQSELDSSLRHLGLCLQGFRDTPQRFRFIRARNPDILARLLALPDIEKIDGFVLPKFNAANFHAYFDQLQGTAFKIMPTLETRDVFDVGAMRELREALLQETVFARILMLRIGGNDLMNLLGIRRPRQMTLYETPLGHIIAQLVTVFKPYGFSLSAPVFEYLDDTATLQQEIRLDLAHGLTGKTAIHPVQVPVIEAMYSVDSDDYDMAQALCQSESPAVFRMHDAMCEVATHQQWGQHIMDRRHYYGESLLLPGYTELFVN